MPRKVVRNLKRRSLNLDEDYNFITIEYFNNCLTGYTEEERRIIWKKNVDKFLKAYFERDYSLPGSRPSGWWKFIRESKAPSYIDWRGVTDYDLAASWDYLITNDLLLDGELEQMREYIISCRQRAREWRKIEFDYGNEHVTCEDLAKRQNQEAQRLKKVLQKHGLEVGRRTEKKSQEP